MSINIACSTLDCTNPVIGQCTGYKKACGKYYCRAHSMDTLCGECASRKSADDKAQAVYEDYVHTAEQMEHDKTGSTFVNWEAIKGWVISLVISIFILIISPAMPISNHGFNETNAGTVIGGLMFALSLFGLIVKTNKLTSDREKITTTEIEKTKPGFLEFYSCWKSKKNKEQLMAVLTVVGAIAVIGLAAAATAASAASESDYDRTRRAVRDEMNRN